MYLRLFWQSPSLSNLLVIDQAWTKKLKPTCSAILVFSFLLSSKFRKEYISNCHDKHSYKQTASRILNPLLCAWEFGKTRSLVFDAIAQLSPCFININYLWLVGFFFQKIPETSWNWMKTKAFFRLFGRSINLFHGLKSTNLGQNSNWQCKH